MNCFKDVQNKQTAKKFYEKNYRKFFFLYAHKLLLGAIRELNDNGYRLKIDNFMIDYDRELRNINFYFYPEPLKRCLFANLCITPKGKKYLYFMDNHSYKVRDEFLEVLNINTLKKHINEEYAIKKKNKQLASDNLLGLC